MVVILLVNLTLIISCCIDSHRKSLVGFSFFVGFPRVKFSCLFVHCDLYCSIVSMVDFLNVYLLNDRLKELNNHLHH